MNCYGKIEGLSHATAWSRMSQLLKTMRFPAISWPLTKTEARYQTHSEWQFAETPHTVNPIINITSIRLRIVTTIGWKDFKKSRNWNSTMLKGMWYSYFEMGFVMGLISLSNEFFLLIKNHPLYHLLTILEALVSWRAVQFAVKIVNNCNLLRASYQNANLSTLLSSIDPIQ